VELTRAHLRSFGLTAEVRTANAESLPFGDDAFDLVASSGVLHHTPNTQMAFREAFRVLKANGVAKITLYRLGFLHSPLIFPLTRAVMRVLAVKHPGADMSRTAMDVQDFVRQYDGADNPVGIAKTNEDWGRNLSQVGFRVDGADNHFFPKRFLPLPSLIPVWAHRLLDLRLGTMVYFRLTKPSAERPDAAKRDHGETVVARSLPVSETSVDHQPRAAALPERPFFRIGQLTSLAT
jgi:SAM-dependent methyltransferase